MVTVDVIAYNEEKYIKTTINSLLNQTCKTFKLVIGDNGSVDETLNIIREMQNEGNEFQVMRKAENINMHYALELVEAADTEYVTVYHADDVYDDNIVQRESDICQKYNLDACFTLKRDIFEDGSLYHYDFSYLNRYLTKDRDLLFLDRSHAINDLIQYGDYFNSPSLMIKKDIFIKYGGYDITPATGHFYNTDMWLYLKLLNDNCRVGIIPEELMSYRISATQQSAKGRKEGYYSWYFVDMDYFIDNSFGRENVDRKALSEYNKRKARNLGSVMAYYKSVNDLEKVRYYSNIKNTFKCPNLIFWRSYVLAERKYNKRRK